MHKSEIKILLVDDDEDIARALKETLKRAGFNLTTCHTPQEALNLYRVQSADLLIIDCLLPQMPGVQLAQELRKMGAQDTPLFLTSAIYKDKAFIRDALKTTGAKQFLSKPMDLKELVGLVEEALADLVDPELSAREQLLMSSLTPQERLKNINLLEEIEGFEIPWILCQISAPSFTGVLTLTEPTAKHNYKLGILKGEIVNIECNNPNSFFGAILVENGYITLEQLNQILQINSPKPIGERLVENHLLSPHMIEVIRAEQMGLRLSRAICDRMYKIKFLEEKVGPSSVKISSDQICHLLADWIFSKFNLSWLESYHMKWRDRGVHKSPMPTHLGTIGELEPLKNQKTIIELFNQGNALDAVLAKIPQNDLVYRIYHLLLITGAVQLESDRKVLDSETQSVRLERILKHMQNQDYFGILGLRRNAKAPEIKKTYYELAKTFHPDRFEKGASEKQKELTQKIFGLITKAHETISDDSKRDLYIKTLDLGDAEKFLKAEELLERGKSLLRAGQAAKALQEFEASKRLRPPSGELIIHWSWAKLATVGTDSKAQNEISAVNNALDLLPPEDRHNATYYYVKALLQKTLGNLPLAKKMVNQALSLDPKFLDAERLNRILDLTPPGEKDLNILTGDLKDIVANLFKKKN